MVTFEQLLVKYLYQHKQVSLQGFGTVNLNNTIPETEYIHKNRQIPVEGAAFVYNPKAQTDPEFVLFFSQQRGKIKPLAESDIESHLQLARQLMNIGKPYEVEGLGMFAMQKDGNVLLLPGHYAVPSADVTNHPNRLRERTEHEERTEAESKSGAVSNTAKKILLAVAILLVIVVAGWFLWSKFLTTDPNATATPPTADTLTQEDVLPVRDTNTVTLVAPSATDTVLWRAYFRSFTGKSNLESMLRLYQRSGTIMAETADSVNYRLYVLVNSPATDTAAKIDSLHKVFLRPITIEKAAQ